MVRFAASSVLVVAMITGSSAQFLGSTSGLNNAEALDSADYYDSNDNTTYLDAHDIDNTLALGSSVSAMNGPWSATFANGVASGSGEAAQAQETFSNGATSALFSAFISADSQAQTTQTGAGPYYGVAGGAFGTASCSLDFTATQATLLSCVGSMTGSGNDSTVNIRLFDFTTSTFTTILSQGSGTYAVNSSLLLTTGDDYELSIGVLALPKYQYDPANSINLTGVDGATGYITASFQAAPEPLTWGLLGLGAFALLRRRRTR